MSRRRVIVGMAAWIVAVSASRATPPTEFFDGDFQVNWQWTQINAGHGGTATFYTEPSIVPGNPGYLVYTQTYVAADCSAIYGFGINLAATYDPSEDGAIGYIEYSEDAIMLNGFGDGQATGPALRQNGNMYIAIGQATGTQTTWHAMGQGRLGAKDFVHVVGGACPGYVDESSHPDFSDEGSTIEFGFFRANSQIDGQIDYGILCGLDNWHVAVHPFHYAALGDSYSAGEGLRDYLDGTDSDAPRNKCHRSHLAYGYQIEYPGITLEDEAFLACSGAKTYNIDPEPQGTRPDNAKGEPTQLSRTFPPPDDATFVVNDDTDMVTLSVGGNDLGFAEILRMCITHLGSDCDADSYKPFQLLGDNRSLKQYVEARLSDVALYAGITYDAIKARAQHAAIFVLGYPRLFGGTCMEPALSTAERTWLDQVGDQLNQKLACTAAAKGVHMLQVATAFAAHGACSAAPWINDLDVNVPIFNDFIDSRSFHPTAQGQRAYAKVLDDYIRARVTQQAPLTAGGVPANPAPTTPPGCGSMLRAEAPTTATPSLGALTVVPEGTPPCDGRGRYVAGQQVRVSGNKFGASASVTIRLESGVYAADLATVTANGAGDLDAVATIPNGSPTNVSAQMSARGLGAAGEPRLIVKAIGLSTSFSSDADGDGVPDPCDLCAGLNAPGVDSDGDDVGDACDPCPLDDANDVDADGLCANVDPCPLDAENDADSDSVCESDDNCPTVSNAGQLDLDKDGVGSACDVAPSDPGVFALPQEVNDLVFGSDRQTLTWTSAVGSAGALTVHDVTRGMLGSFPVGNGDTCLAAGVSAATATDLSVPPPGQGYWYLVRARNTAGVGTWGFATGGAERVSFACPFE